MIETYSPRSEQDEVAERLRRKAEESPTLGALLDGRFEARRISDDSSVQGLDADPYTGQLGRWTCYETTIEGVRPDGSGWGTYMSVWRRLPLEASAYGSKAKTKLHILTGDGDVPFSDDPEVTQAVILAIEQKVAESVASN
jgi:hypothetical protein